MQTSHMQVLAALRQAQHFLDANQASLGGINATGARKTLDETIDKISSLAEIQDSHRILVTGQRANEFRLSAELRRLILRGASTAELQKQACDDGMMTLRMDGIVKIRKGVTTLEEVVKETAEG